MNINTNFFDDKDTPFIFVMLPTFNRPDLVIRAVNSVLNQCCSNYKLYIFNDGSSANYSELEKLICGNKNVIYHKHDINIGINKSRNLMLDYCSDNLHGQNVYFCTLSDDDYFLPGAFTEITKQIVFNRNKVWMCFNCESLSQDVFKNTCYTSYSEVTYDEFRRNYKGDKHFVFKLSCLKGVRYPDKFFKNGYEHIFYYKINSKIFTVPMTVKTIEYQADGLSLGPLYADHKKLSTIIKHILSDPTKWLYYRWLFKELRPISRIKKAIFKKDMSI